MNREISNAEYELGRYRKKVKEQAEELRMANRKLEDALDGVQELRVAVDAIICSLSKQYGERVKDESTGEVIGYRIHVAYPFAMDSQFSIRCSKQPESHEMTIGLIKKIEG